MTYCLRHLHSPLLTGCGKERISNAEIERAAYRAQKRWPKAPSPVTYVVARKPARQLLGARPSMRPLRAREVTHDLHVASLYLKLERRAQRSWVHEDYLDVEPGEPVPDAVLLNRPGLLCIDFIGQYSASKLSSMAERYLLHETSFEFW
jgi:hypothetical protein